MTVSRKRWLSFFLRWFLPAALVLLTGVVFYGRSEAERELSRLRSRETLSVGLGAGALTGQIESISRDLAFLASHSALRRAVADPKPENLALLAEDFANFSRSKRVYDQLRWLDETGMEVVRVDFVEGRPRVVPPVELQNKGRRYFFTDAIRLNPGEIFISPLDLNIEQDKIQVPHKPMLRIATPVLDKAGNKRGIVILNYYGREMLQAFASVAADISDHVMLVNGDGYWLKSPNPDDEWGFMFKRSELTLGARAADAWARIRDEERGQATLADGLWTWQTIHPLLEGQRSSTGASEAFLPSRGDVENRQYAWKSVAHLSATALDEVTQAVWTKLLGLSVVLLGLLGFGSWKFAQADAAKEVARINAELERQVAERTHALLAANEDLANREALLKQIFDASSVAIFLVDRRGRITQANQRMAEMFGRPLDALLGKEYVELVHPAERETGHKKIMALLSGSIESVDLERQYRRGDNSEFWGHLTGQRCYDGKGMECGLVGVIVDISVRKQAEEKLKESEAFKEAILNSVTAEIAVVDRDGVIVSTNEAWRRFALENGADPVTSTDIKVNYLAVCEASVGDWEEEGSHDARDGILKVLEGRSRLFSLEYPCHSPEHQRWFAMSVTPLGGEERGAVIVHTNITERKQAEAELLRSNSELEQFSYAISHDLRQPLRMISSYLHLLETDLAERLDGEQREYFNFAIDGARRLDAMMVGLLECSRIGRKGEPLAWVESRAVLDEALLFLQPAIAEAHAEICIAGDWPRILVSPDEMLRLVQNLVGNALKFRIAGRPAEVVVTSETTHGRWRLRVADNGIGIPPDKAGRLFQVFQRLQLRTAYEGTGIGLALCRKIAERHGGCIGVQSDGEGAGSCFHVELPLPPETACNAGG